MHATDYVSVVQASGFSLIIAIGGKGVNFKLQIVFLGAKKMHIKAISLPQCKEVTRILESKTTFLAALEVLVASMHLQSKFSAHDLHFCSFQLESVTVHNV